MSIRNHTSYDEFIPPMVGETCLHNGQKSMCIESEANYGGGSGPLWATENHIAQFALRDFWWRGYMRGYCQRVDPVRKSVQLQVLTGPSWGWLAQGCVVELPASRIKRYDSLEFAPTDLCSLSIEAEATAQAKSVFEHVTREELNQLFIGAQDLYRVGVVVEPGAFFYPTSPKHCASMRLGYSSIATERIEPGVQAMAVVLKQHMRRR